jgi:serine/threonine-protein kinase
MNSLSGQSLGRYHLIEKLGEGGMAVIYKAFDTRLECEVAVKVIRMERLAPEIVNTTLKRFEREAKAVAQLTHPNIVKVSDYGEENGVPYLVMPYLAGGTLKQILGKPIPYMKAARLLAPVADALQYAHEHKVVHRDVKPSNILITESGAPMLTDFGIARILDLQEGQTLTGTGVGIGTPEYMAPEQWTGDITPAVDIYSLGVVFYELVTGHKPYTADTPAAVLLKQATEPLPRPSAFNPDLSERVEQVLFKAMAKKAEDRYQTMADFENALDQMRVESGAHERSDMKLTQSAATADRLGTTDTFSTHLENITKERPQEKEEPKKPIAAKKNKTGIWIGLGTLVIIGFFLLIGNATNWFGGSATPVVTFPPLATEAPYTTEAPSLGIGSTMISPIDGMEMVYVPAGEFIMGSRGGAGESDEDPQHTVYLDAYWIDKTEVTNTMYKQCVDEGVCTIPDSLYSHTHISYYGDSIFADYPVIYVDWFQAKAYCEWAGRSLPTEAQWEKAARGENGATYPWRNSSPDSTLANYNDNIGDTTEVGMYEAGASPYGALDMAGNVYEWTADWYEADYYYSNNSQSNPSGPVNGVYRVLRDGSWYSSGFDIRSANRNADDPADSYREIGFRCALPLH